MKVNSNLKPKKDEIKGKPASPIIKIMFITGIILLIVGFALSHGWVMNLTPKTDNFLTGTIIAILGAVVIALAARLSLSQKYEFLLLPVPEFRSNVKGLTALAIAIILYFVLIFNLYRNNYSNWYVLLFSSALFLIGYATYKLFTSKNAITKRLFNKTDFLIVTALIGLVIAINLIGLTSWNFSIIGDEGEFEEYAHALATGRQANMFDLTAAYETHPMLDSIYLAVLMKAFGLNIFVWRLSLVFVQAASAALAYLIASLLIGRMPGIVAGIVLGSSHYIMAFNRNGYNNTHSLFYSLVAVLMLVLAWRTRKNIYVYLTGLAMGFCLYTFMAAILIWAIIALILLIDSALGRDLKQIYAWAIMFMGFLLVITPALMVTSPTEIIGIAHHETRREESANQPLTVAKLSLEKTVLAFWGINYYHGHYVLGPLVDIITKTLLLVGIAVSLLFFNKIESRLAFLWFILGIVLIAFTNYKSHASITRLLFVLPGVALLSANAIGKTENLFQNVFNLNRKITQGIFLSLCVLLLFLNIYQVQVYSPIWGAFHPFDMTVKAFQEYPEKNIVHVGKEKPFEFMPVWLGWHGLSERYSEANETETAILMSQNVSSLPIFLVYAEEKDIAFNLSEKLSSQYQLTTDYDLSGAPTTYLLIPKDAIKIETLTDKILKIFYPFKKYEKYIIGNFPV